MGMCVLTNTMDLLPTYLISVNEIGPDLFLLPSYIFRFKIHVMNIIYIHYRQKIWNIFYFTDFLHFCGVCRLFLYLKYISTRKYYFGGSQFALNSNMKRNGSKTIISVFFSIRLWLKFLLSLCQIAAISIRVLHRYIEHNTIVYLLLILVRSAGD